MENNKSVDRAKEQIIEVKKGVEMFLEHQSVDDRGAYAYSFSGDINRNYSDWGCGTSSFALKLLYCLGVDKNDLRIINAIEHILHFEHKNGYIFDSYIFKKSYFTNIKESIVNLQWSNLKNQKYIRAESRQCHSSLLLFNQIPRNFPCDIKLEYNWIVAQVDSLDWRHPWDAGSHFSHYMFYLKLAYKMGIIQSEEYELLCSRIIEHINQLQDNKTGSWFRGNPSIQEKINGAMKVITGLYTVGVTSFDFCQELVDFCLANVNNSHACDNFNIVYVLHKASKNCPDYRQEEIVDFFLRRIEIYMKYYYPHEGGFSFFVNKSNANYYGAKISRGFSEPDMHGTTLFMWGLSIISEVLGISDELGLREFLT